MSVRITCIKKSNGYHNDPYTAIQSMNWVNEDNNEKGTSTRKEMYDWIKKGGYGYVADSAGNRAKLITGISASGTEYVKTVADNTTSDNLLKLPECR